MIVKQKQKRMKTNMNYYYSNSRICFCALLFFYSSGALTQTDGMVNVSSAFETRVKPRVIATTDGEKDDRSTMIRFLVTACDYEIAALFR